MYGEAPAPEAGLFAVWPENWASHCVFVSLATQWIVSDGLAGRRYHGIRYPSIESVMWAHRIPARDRRAVFDDVRLMEASALNVINKAGE